MGVEGLECGNGVGMGWGWECGNGVRVEGLECGNGVGGGWECRNRVQLTLSLSSFSQHGRLS